MKQQMTTKLAMSEIAQGKMREYTLRDSRVVVQLYTVKAGRVLVSIDGTVDNMLLRDLRSLFNDIGFAGRPMAKPLADTKRKAIIEPGVYALSVTQDTLAPIGVHRVLRAIKAIGVCTDSIELYPLRELVQRVNRASMQQRGHTLRDGEKSDIATILAEWTIPRGTYWFDIVNSLDWREGAFGDGGSCYWNGRVEARAALDRTGGMALRFFTETQWRARRVQQPEDHSGTGRVWLYPSNDGGLFVFNAYGWMSDTYGVSLSKESGASIVSLLTRTIGRRVNLSNFGDPHGTVWINSGSGIKLGGSLKSSSGDLQLRVIPEDSERFEDQREHCVSCGCELWEDEGYWPEHYHNGPYCEECYSERWARCDCCGDETDRDEITTLHCQLSWQGRPYDNDLCEYCFEKHGGHTCDDCGDTFNVNLGGIDCEDGCYCEDCMSDYVTYCECCEEYRNSDDFVHVHTQEAGTVSICGHCDNEGYIVCECCGAIRQHNDPVPACICYLTEDDQLAFSYAIAMPQYAVYPGLLA